MFLLILIGFCDIHAYCIVTYWNRYHGSSLVLPRRNCAFPPGPWPQMHENTEVAWAVHPRPEPSVQPGGIQSIDCKFRATKTSKDLKKLLSKRVEQPNWHGISPSFFLSFALCFVLSFLLSLSNRCMVASLLFAGSGCLEIQPLCWSVQSQFWITTDLTIFS